jgi:hypothetical protein
MLMNARVGQRLVDNCFAPAQREAAEKAVAPGSELSIAAPR